MKQILLLASAVLLLLPACNNQGSGASAETDLEAEKPGIQIRTEKSDSITEAAKEKVKEPTPEEKYREKLRNPVPFNLKMQQLVGSWTQPEGNDDKPSGFILRKDGSMSFINEPGRKGLRFEVINDSLVLHFRFDGYKQKSTSTWIIRDFKDSTLTLGAIEALSYRRTYRRG